MWIPQKESFKRVFSRLKEPIEINGQPAEGMVFVYGESEEQKLEGYGIVESSHVNLWLLPETPVEVGDEVKLRGNLYRVVEIKDYLGIAKKVVLERTDV